MTGNRSVATDGGGPTTLPANWRAVECPDRTVYQRRDVDHYIVVEGTDEQTVILCSQGDRVYPAPLTGRTILVDADRFPVIVAFAAASNDLIEPPKGEH